MREGVILRRTSIQICLMVLMVTLSACFMMPIMMAPMYYGDSQKKEDADVIAVLGELVEESVDALNSNRAMFDKILLKEIEVKDDILPVPKFQQMLLTSLQRKKIETIVEHDTQVDNSVMSHEVLTVLNTQLYRKEGALWFELQLLNLQSNIIVWSGSYTRLFSYPT